MLMPMEFHADTTQLVQMLRQGHHGVALDSEAWDRLITWINLNSPFHGTWTESAGVRVHPLAQRRRELLQRYAGVDSDPESEAAAPARKKVEPVVPPVEPPRKHVEIACDQWPCDAAEAQRRQRAAADPFRQTVRLADGVGLDLVLIPSGGLSSWEATLAMPMNAPALACRSTVLSGWDDWKSPISSSRPLIPHTTAEWNPALACSSASADSTSIALNSRSCACLGGKPWNFATG